MDAFEAKNIADNKNNEKGCLFNLFLKMIEKSANNGDYYLTYDIDISCYQKMYKDLKEKLEKKGFKVKSKKSKYMDNFTVRVCWG